MAETGVGCGGGGLGGGKYEQKNLISHKPNMYTLFKFIQDAEGVFFHTYLLCILVYRRRDRYKKFLKKIQIRKKISNRYSTKYQKHEPIKILPGVVLQEARGVGVGPRHLQERLRGDVEYSSGPTLDGVVANTTVPGFGPCLVLLVNPIPREQNK